MGSLHQRHSRQSTGLAHRHHEGVGEVTHSDRDGLITGLQGVETGQNVILHVPFHAIGIPTLNHHAGGVQRLTQVVVLLYRQGVHIDAGQLGIGVGYRHVKGVIIGAIIGGNPPHLYGASTLRICGIIQNRVVGDNARGAVIIIDLHHHTGGVKCLA